MENSKKTPDICEDCFYFKIREVDPKTGKLEFGYWCLESGQATRCEDVASTCDLAQELQEQPQENDKQLALKYSSKRKR